jgi:hypothetical protein
VRGREARAVLGPDLGDRPSPRARARGWNLRPMVSFPGPSVRLTSPATQIPLPILLLDLRCPALASDSPVLQRRGRGARERGDHVGPASASDSPVLQPAWSWCSDMPDRRSGLSVRLTSPATRNLVKTNPAPAEVRPQRPTHQSCNPSPAPTPTFQPPQGLSREWLPLRHRGTDPIGRSRTAQALGRRELRQRERSEGLGASQSLSLEQRNKAWRF